jgi:membrane-associated phospholipid phosphatase
MAAVAAIALVALSRVRLGVHWPSDVVGGVLFGLGLVCLLVATLRSWRARTLKM